MSITFAEEQGRREVALHALKRLVTGAVFSREQLFSDHPNKEAKKHHWQSKFLRRLVALGVVSRFGPSKGPWVRFKLTPGIDISRSINDPDELTKYLWPHLATGGPPPADGLWDEDDEQPAAPARLEAAPEPESADDMPDDEMPTGDVLTVLALTVAKLTKNVIYLRTVIEESGVVQKQQMERLESMQRELLDMWKPTEKTA
jgi:hypothetical protein